MQGLSAAATLVSAAAVSKVHAAEQCVDESKIITRARYEQYIALYNVFDLAFLDYYTDDITLDSMPPIKGRAAALDFFREIRSYAVDTIEVQRYVADATGAAARVVGEFHCVRDMPATALSGLFGRSVKKGQVRRQLGTLMYGVKGGKFSSISPAPPVTLQDWT
jgi:ketosteroid isomerase-like protein